jgi:putative glutamine amidotransferase
MSDSRDMKRPVVGVISDLIDVDGAGVHAVRCRYSEALRMTACVTPVILPTKLSVDEVDDLVSTRLDGVLLTGSSSNVCPARYGQSIEFDEHLLDQARDSLVVMIIQAAERYGIPLFGICRGLQELNVAFGGSLHQALAEREGAICHEEDCSRPRDEQYWTSHTVRLREGGLLARVFQSGSSPDLPVNSLHRQGIDRLAERFTAEAVAPDGLIEAISVSTSRAPMFAVQWHPEWFHAEDPVSDALFRAFGTFCREALSVRGHVRDGANLSLTH